MFTITDSNASHWHDVARRAIQRRGVCRTDALSQLLAALETWHSRAHRKGFIPPRGRGPPQC